MKMIIAMVQPFTLNKLTDALENIENFPGMTVVEAHGFGFSRRAEERSVIDPFKPKTHIEIVARDEMVEPIIKIIQQYAHTGRHGDGKIFVLPVESAVRVRTGEVGDAAI